MRFVVVLTIDFLMILVYHYHYNIYEGLAEYLECVYMNSLMKVLMEVYGTIR